MLLTRRREGHHGHGALGSPVASYRSQAARRAARSSRATLGELAGLPLLISAPCSHCEQISTRGSDAAVAPTWPQYGQVIRVSMSVVLPQMAQLHRFLIARVAERFGDERFPQIFVPEEGLLARFGGCSPDD